MILIAGSNNPKAKSFMQFFNNQGYNYLVKVDEDLENDLRQFYPSFSYSYLETWLTTDNNSSQTEFIIDFSNETSVNANLLKIGKQNFIAYIGIDSVKNDQIPYYTSLLETSDVSEESLHGIILSLMAHRKESGQYSLSKSVNIPIKTDEILSADVLTNIWSKVQQFRLPL